MKKVAWIPGGSIVKRAFANRVLTVLLCVAMLIGTLPVSALAALLEGETIVNVAAPDPAVYTVDAGTELADVGLPAGLTVSIQTPPLEEGAVPEERMEDVDVKWIGDYDKDTAGDYTLTAAFVDESLTFAPMPTVQITVNEAVVPLMTDIQEMPETSEAPKPSEAPVGSPEQLSEAAEPLTDDVNQGVVCELTPKKTTYNTGEMIQFNLYTQFSDPGDHSELESVTFGIDLPATTPELQFPMFSDVGTGEYDGMPKFSLNYSGISTDFYIVTLENGNRRIEYTLYPGDTITGYISMRLPNGVSSPVTELALEPKILSQGEYTNIRLEGGKTSVSAEFGWENVAKTGSLDNLGVINSATKDPDHIEYTITADSQSSGIAVGRIFTQSYILKDSIALNGVQYADGELTSSKVGNATEYYIDGEKVLEINKTGTSLTVNKIVSGGKVTGFSIVYVALNNTLGNTDGTASELENLNMKVSLFLNAMALGEETGLASVVNTAVFDAYSHFYSEQNDTKATHHQSTATHTAYTSDRYIIEKTVYSDQDCTNEITQISEGSDIWYKIVVTNDSSSSGPFSITDELPSGMTYIYSDPEITSQSDNTLTWSDVSIQPGTPYTILLNVKYDATTFTSNPLRNTAILRKDGQRIVSDYVDVKYLAGTVADATIIYTKNVDKTSAGLNDTLRYTITARNANAADPAKLITITDKWPGENISPVAITGCTEYELLDAQNKSYTLAQVKANPTIIITTIKLYNVRVPKGNVNKATVYIDGKVTTPVTELKNELVGNSGEELASTYSVGVGISKAAFSFDAATGVGAALTNADAVLADDIVCYQLTLKNLTNIDLAGLKVVDKMPDGLTPESVTTFGVTGEAIIKRGSDSYTEIELTRGTAQTGYTPYTTSEFDLNGNETVTLYVFVRVSADAVTASNSGPSYITNAAYVELPNDLVTGDATANIYTHVDTAQQFYIKKEIVFVADYDEGLVNASTQLLGLGGIVQQWNKNDIIWDGAYVGYRFQLMNRNNGANNDPVRVYELIDSLPQGMEFVGVGIGGDSGSYAANTANAVKALNNLGTRLIYDGETGTWSNSQYTAQQLTCRYDRASNQLHITFNEGDSGALMVKYYASGEDVNLSPYIYLIARVTDGAKQARYTNTVDAKVDSNVGLYYETALKKPATKRDGDGADEKYSFISNSCDIGPVLMKPGIDKKLIGHYFPNNTTTPGDADVTNGDAIYPKETLRFQIQVGNSVLSSATAGANIIHSSLQDFVVTDILPAEYVYRPGSATVTLNVPINIADGTFNQDERYTKYKKTIERGQFEPTVEVLDDGRTKLTWDFTRAEYRLLVFTLGLYSVHMITYDADWNPDCEEVYGNFENTASVTHSAYFSSVYSGTPDYDANTITATEVVNVFGAAGTVAVKSVTNEAGNTAYGNITANGGNRVTITGAGEHVRYSLKVTNSSAESQMRSLVIIDELPRAQGDTGVVNRKDRGSEFNVLFDAAPDVEVFIQIGTGDPVKVDESNYTVHYGTSAGGFNSTGDWSQATTGGRVDWGSDSDGKNAIRIAFNSEYVEFISNTSVIVSFSAVAGEDAGAGEVAWNSFGYSYRSHSTKDDTESSKIFSEPQKVGIAVPGATISVGKVVTGDAAPADAVFSFVLKQNGMEVKNVRYTVSGLTGNFFTTDAGVFTLKAGQTATLYVTPEDGYTVEEVLTDLNTGFTFESAVPKAESDGTVDNLNNQVFTCKELTAGDSAGVVYTNLYTTPQTVDVSVEKHWSGAVDPNPPASVNVQLYRDGEPEGAPVTLNAHSDWKYKWENLVSSFAWTVKEVGELPDGYSSVVTGDSVNGFVITNRYTRQNGTLTISKTVTGGDDANAEFDFRLTFSEAGRWPYVTSSGKTGSVATGESIRLGNGQSVTITIPQGVTYAVVEDTYTSYAPTPANRTFNGTIGATESRADYVNQYEAPYVPSTQTGNLTVQKTVTGELGETDKDFTFTVTFNAEGSYTYIGSKNGTIASGDTFTLKHREYITILNLPAGTQYSVAETADSNYNADATGATGAIAANGVSTAAFTNACLEQPGKLTVSKTVTGGGNAGALFTFRFTFDGNRRYPYQTKSGKTGTIATGESIQLGNGDSVTITLPQGVTYTVVEDEYSDYVPTPANRTFTGTIGATESRADYVNQYQAPYIPPTQTGSLTIKKTVTGELGEKDKDFAFKITFDAEGSYAYSGSKSGAIASGDTVMLKHGEYITIVNLPAGTKYSVAETADSNYKADATGDTGVIAANGVSTAAFTNAYVEQTGKLTVSKTVTGGDAGALFTFRFTFSGDRRYPYQTQSGKTGTIATGESIQLGNGDSVTITIPQGVTYTVVEDEYADYIPTPANRTFEGTIGAVESRAEYTNQYKEPYNPPTQTGSLTVQKTVTGELGEKDKDFAFKITFDAEGRYVYSGSKRGEIVSGDTVMLKHGEYITIENLPAGTKYSVAETADSNYKIDATGDTGVIAANEASTAAFINAYVEQTGKLTVSKTVTGGDAGALFTFRFTFSGDMRYSYQTQSGKTGTIATGESIQLGNGDSVTITIPQGVTYTVVEDEYADYIPTPANRTFEGSIGAVESRAEYTNQYKEPYVPPTQTGSLTIRKTVTGDMGEKDKDFAFKITFDAEGSYVYSGSKRGEIVSGDTVMLKHGEYITIENLPAGTKYSVEESGNSGYVVDASGAKGVIAANGAATAAFTNSRSQIPKAGDDNSTPMLLALMFASLVAAATLLMIIAKRKRGAHKARKAR